MFYLGGLSLGYLTPHPVPSDANVVVKPMQAQTRSRPVAPEPGGTRSGEPDERPILWPWHIFY